MPTVSNTASTTLFEIDQPDQFGQFILNNPLEILRNLQALTKQGGFVSVYFDRGENFFLSTVLAVDENRRSIVIDAPRQEEVLQQALQAGVATLCANLDRIKIQCHLQRLLPETWEERKALVSLLPEKMLRLQRREFFRIQTPLLNPLRCRLIRQHGDGRSEVFDFPLHDISGGGVCLIAPIEMAEKFSLGELFADCRLDIPGESVLSVNLRVRELAQLEMHDGQPQLRLGCEFFNLPGTRLSLIERYITRQERSSKARLSGLA